MDFSSLNPAQREAVKHIDGPCCVLAGAGSGKTRVLTQRIGYLVADCGIAPQNILAVTFTKKAANEMSDRLELIVGAAALEALNVGTFHSICYRILRGEWRRQDMQFYEPFREWEQKKLIRNILAVPGKENPYGMNWEMDICSAMSFISWQKNNLLGWRDSLQKVPEGMEGEYRDLYHIYEQEKEKMGKLDFDDMLLWTYQLLKQNPAICAKYVNQFRYILVDEYQDTNQAQHEILKLWALPTSNVFVVGDDYQGIYGWRAARLEFILRFQEIWPGAKIIKLETNYRSSSNIVDFSNSLILHNTNQVHKNMKAHQGRHLDPIMLEHEDEDVEGKEVVAEIQNHIDNGRGYRECAVLYRVNAQSGAMEDALIRAQIPYTIIGAAGFYARKEVKDILAYLRIVQDPNDAEAIERVINTPTRYIGKVFIQRAKDFARINSLNLLQAISSCLEAQQRKYRGAREFVSCIKRLQFAAQSLANQALVEEVRRVTGYDDWLQENEGADEADNPRLDNLDRLAKAAANFSNLKDFLFYAEQAGSKPSSDEKGDKVQLMTYHRAKGLEFLVVFMVGVNQGLLPHNRSIEYRDNKILPESVAEERRLCYVGMTRAERILYLSSTEMYNNKDMEPSMFLDEIFSGRLAEVVGI